MATAPRDENFVPAMLFTGSDGLTYPLEGDEATGRIYVDLAGGSGTVTSVSVVSANGLAGTVATATTTPAITLSTTINSPILAGNGTAITAATTTGSGSTAVLATAPVFPTTITVGAAGGATGDILLKGTTSGTVTITTADAAGTWTMQLPSNDGDADQFLKTDGSGITSWATVSGTGDVVGPASATDNALARFDLTTGKLLQDGTVSSSDVTGGQVLLSSIGNNDLVLQTGNATTGSITITDGANGNITLAPNGTGDVIITPTGTDSVLGVVNGGSSVYTYAADNSYAEVIITAEDNSKIDANAVAGDTYLQITDTSAGVAGPNLTLYHNSASPAASDVVGSFDFQGRDSGAGVNDYASIKGVITDPTAASEDGKLVFNVITAGTNADELELTGSALYPTTNDGLALGSTTNQFSDIFLAEGGVINFDNGDVTVTQTGNVLAVAGGDLQVATAGVGTNADSVPTLSSTSTFTNKTLTSPTINTATIGGATLLAENASIDLDPSLSADGTYSGIAITGTAGATLAFGDLIYLAAADSRWELVDADSVTTCGAVLTGMCVLAAAGDGSATKILLQGNIRADAAFPALTIGANVYAGLTAGDIVTTAPSATDDVVHVVGKALTADSIYFNPSMDYITIV